MLCEMMINRETRTAAIELHVVVVVVIVDEVANRRRRNLG